MKEKLNFKINIPGKGEVQNSGFRKIKKIVPTVHLQGLIRIIKGKGLDQEVEDKLIKMASSYPHGALAQFNQQLDKHIRNAAMQVGKENVKRQKKEE